MLCVVNIYVQAGGTFTHAYPYAYNYTIHPSESVPYYYRKNKLEKKMPQYKIFDGYAKDDVVSQVNTFISENNLTWRNVCQDYQVTVILVDVSGETRVVYRHFILLRYKLDETFQGA